VVMFRVCQRYFVDALLVMILIWGDDALSWMCRGLMKVPALADVAISSYVVSVFSES
jgi:hypothetical protein